MRHLTELEVWLLAAVIAESATVGVFFLVTKCL